MKAHMNESQDVRSGERAAYSSEEVRHLAGVWCLQYLVAAKGQNVLTWS